MTHRFLRHEGDVLAVFRHVEVLNRLFVELWERMSKPISNYQEKVTYVNSSGLRVVEPLNELDSGRLSATTSTDKSDVGTGLDAEVQVTEDTNTSTSGVTEVNVLEADTTLDILGNLAFSGVRVDLGDRVEQVNDVTSGTLGRGNIGDE